jgi:dUTP pyrophosphatase
MAVTIKYIAKSGATIPSYQTSGAAGADICAFIDEPAVLHPGERKLVSTGIRVEIPEGYEIQVRPRSGLALKYGLTVLNAPGTIDSDYRGEIGIVLINHGSEAVTVSSGDRIAQLVVAPVAHCRFVEAPDLSETERGAGGYGSTGKN